MVNFYIIDKLYNEPIKRRVPLNSKELITLDFTAWQANHDTITDVDWTVQSGQLSITGDSLASGVASATLEYAQQGRQIVKVTATTADETLITHIDVYVYDTDCGVDDYGR